jgi:hypothetical protein
LTRPAPLQLALDEAVELCTAWLAYFARANGIRVLVLKGAALTRQGLRDTHPSSDVDILVDPPRFNEFLALIEAAGWGRFEETFATEQFTSHSLTLRRDGWPNSIDVHSSWPGFLRAADETFAVLWHRRVQLEYGGVRCDVPDRQSNFLMLALHSLRGNTHQVRHQRELEHLLRIDLDDGERAEIERLARLTGSVAPLRHVLSAVGIGVSTSTDELRGAPYLEWHRKLVQTRTRGRAASWIIELRRVDWRRKPVILRHAVWPTDHDLLAEHPTVPDRALARTWARIARLGRGMRQLPRVIPALRRR